MLEEFEPRRVMYYFEEISKIPRGSGNEKGISDFIVNFAKDHGLEFNQDEKMNVIVKKKGKGENTLILQAHMDMVCEKNRDKQHDFLKNPIELVIDGDFIKANGTTLGADNGIGVAYNLALLDSLDITHPNIECVFTVDEEEGMTGANSLDLSKLNGNTLINIDSEEEGIITAGCAGGARLNIKLKLSFENSFDGEKFEVCIKGLHGGHSGIDIGKNRGNAIKMMGEILKGIKKEGIDFRIFHIDGGMKTNAIPRESCVKILINKAGNDRLTKTIKEIENVITDKYIANECETKVSINKINEKVDKVFDYDTTEKITLLLGNIFDGVYTMSKDVEGLVESSSNIGIVKQDEDVLEIKILPRSSNNDKLEEIIKNVEELIKKFEGTSMTVDSRYPAWSFDKESRVRDLAASVYKEQYNNKSEINIVHAGLECAVFKEKRKDLDLISIGPNIYSPHTPSERVSISSVQRTWEYIKNIVEKLA